MNDNIPEHKLEEYCYYLALNVGEAENMSN